MEVAEDDDGFESCWEDDEIEKINTNKKSNQVSK